MKKTLVGTVLVMAGLLAPPQVGAGTIRFNDLTDTVTVSTDSLFGSVSGITCAGESCTLTLSAPAGGIILSQFDDVEILEPVTGAISDRLTLAGGHFSPLTVSFTSDDESAGCRAWHQVSGLPPLRKMGPSSLGRLSYTSIPRALRGSRGAM